MGDRETDRGQNDDAIVGDGAVAVGGPDGSVGGAVEKGEVIVGRLLAGVVDGSFEGGVAGGEEDADVVDVVDDGGGEVGVEEFGGNDGGGGGEGIEEEEEEWGGHPGWAFCP